MVEDGKILRMRVNSNILAKARTIFMAGPAAETKAESLLGCFRLRKLTGTGLAVPNMKEPFDNIKSMIGTTTVPIGSICTSGLKESLPIILAVGSPNLFATNPWATSWKVIAIKIGIAAMMRCCAIEAKSKIKKPF